MGLEYSQYAVPGWGVGELWMRDGVVLAHELRFEADAGRGRAPRSPRPPKGAQGPPAGTVPGNSSQVGNASVPDSSRLVEGRAPVDPGDLTARFAAFLAGEDVRFDDVRLDLDGNTPFQQSVTKALRAVPRGEVVSYGELAALAGYPGAARAAGTFCAHNRFMLLVPCHRVVGADGIGGYGSAGVGVKRRLLALEGVEL
jgi:O-6-methylguanine DNA methyltransferase